jgi:hypothetical protein
MDIVSHGSGRNPGENTAAPFSPESIPATDRTASFHAVCRCAPFKQYFLFGGQAEKFLCSPVVTLPHRGFS